MKKEKARVRVQIDKDIADRAEEILDMLGLTPTTAIAIFYNRIASMGKMPFDVSELDKAEERRKKKSE